jgi:hypothetical protein
MTTNPNKGGGKRMPLERVDDEYGQRLLFVVETLLGTYLKATLKTSLKHSESCFSKNLGLFSKLGMLGNKLGCSDVCKQRLISFKLAVFGQY